MRKHTKMSIKSSTKNDEELMLVGTYKITRGKIYIPSIWAKNNPEVKEVDIFIDNNIITIKPATSTPKNDVKNDITEIEA